MEKLYAVFSKAELVEKFDKRSWRSEFMGHPLF
jgi:hypothetical protein